MASTDTTRRTPRTWKNEIAAIVVLIGLAGLVPIIISSCKGSGCSGETDKTEYPEYSLVVAVGSGPATVVAGEQIERELTLSGATTPGGPAVVSIEWTPPSGATDIGFQGRTPFNPDGPPPFVFTDIPSGSPADPERLAVRYTAPAGVLRAVNDTFRIFDPADHSTLHVASLTDPVLGAESSLRSMPPRQASPAGARPEAPTKQATTTRSAWKSQLWIYAEDQFNFERTFCQEVFDPISSGNLFVAVHYPERQGGGVPIVLSEGSEPRVSLIDYSQPSDQWEVMSFDLELAPERMSWIADNLPGAAGYGWTALRADQATVPTCPSDILIYAGSWEFTNVTLIDYADDPDECNGCTLEHYVCWEGQEPPFGTMALTAVAPWKSVQADGVTCIGPGTVRLHDRTNPPEPAFTMVAGEIAQVDSPPERVVFHHWLSNYNSPSSYSINLTAESSMGIDWRFYSNESATAPLSQPVSLPTSNAREIWVAADIPAGTNGIESVKIVATATSAPSNPVWGTNIVQIGEWVPPPEPSGGASRWIPVASRAEGVGGSQWRTDLGLLNPGEADAEAVLRLYLDGTPYEQTVTVPAGNQSVIGDVVGLFGVDGSGALEVEADQNLIATSRTFSLLAGGDPCYPGGTFGQFLAGGASSTGLAAGASGRLPQLAENSSYRTNLAVTNTGDQPATVTVVLFDEAGTEITRFDLELSPGEWKQENRVFKRRGGRTDLDAASAQIIVGAGSGVLAYASVVDNVTTDPTTIPLVAGGGSTTSWVPVASRAEGVGGSQWRTDLGLLNPGSVPVNVTVRYHGGSSPDETQVMLAAGEQMIMQDIVGEFVSEGSGSVEVVSPLPVIATSRTYSLLADDDDCSPNGTFGQFLAGQEVAEGLSAGGRGLLPQLAENGSYRTNLALTNIGSQTATATVILMDEAGVEITRFDLELAPGEWKQENRVFKRRGGRTDLGAASARIEITAGSSVLAYASVVDNTTSDPTTIPLQK